jgi:hypothetical protein
MKFTDITESSHKCPHCGGPMFSEMMMTEKKDACYYKVKASAKVWPSAYASGRLVQCRKKGAGNYGNKSEGVMEMDKSQTPPGRDGSNDSDAGKKEYTAKPTTPEKLAKDGEKILNKELNKKQGVAEAANPAQQAAIAIAMKKAGDKPKNEDYNPEYDDEAGMADNNLETLQRAVEGIDDLIQSGDNLPEWCQEKIAVAKSMLVAVWDYMYSEEASDEVDPEVDEMFEAMDQLAEEMAAKNRVSKDLVWEQFEAMPDNMLYETAAWRRSAGKSKKGGLNAKGVASYRRENPGSKLQMAVTTKPSKLKPGSKAAKRRKSFCARMGGVKGPMKKPNGKPTRKALALRKWNC